VKARELDWKLKALAEKMEDVPIAGTTRIDWDCLTERERMLFDRFCEIRDKYAPSLPPDDVLAENFELFVKGIQLFMRRAIDLFVSVMSSSLGGEVEEWYFKLHFYNFMKDLTDCIENVKKWSDGDRAEFLRDMHESGMIGKVFRLPRGLSEEDKGKVARS
jgi:hypothetical protein